MSASSLAMGAAGLAFTFIPEEVLKLLQSEINRPSNLLPQITGALYVGFAMLNWMNRYSVIGGIYNKPTVMANFAHFFIGAMALIKGMRANPGQSSLLWVITVVYILFAVIFGWLFYKNPSAKTQ